MNILSCIHDLKTLILSFHPVIVMETVEEERVKSLLQAVAKELDLPLYEWTITQGLMQNGKNVTVGGTSKPRVLLEYLGKSKTPGIYWLKDFTHHLKDVAATRQLREVGQKFSQGNSTIILTGTAIELPPAIAHSAVDYRLQLPNTKELYRVFSGVVKTLREEHSISIQLNSKDVEQLLRALKGMTLAQARQAIAYAALLDGKLAPPDIQRVQERKVEMIRSGGLLEYYPEGENAYQLGGFARLKTWLTLAKIGFSRQAQGLNLTPPKGILLVGIQGCGKSLAAKAIARQWKLPLLKLDAGRLYDKYIGESEKNFYRAVTIAESMAPIVLWIDELEKGFGSGVSGNADGGVSRRLFGTFLTWLQEKRQEIFVVATANDVFNLPPELLRKGRFDEIFFVDLPNAQERGEIFRIHLSTRKQNPRKFDFKLLVAESVGFGGAEIEQAIITALYRALHLQKPLNTALLLVAIRETVPLSISRREDIERLRKLASDRFISVR